MTRTQSGPLRKDASLLLLNHIHYLLDLFLFTTFISLYKKILIVLREIMIAYALVSGDDFASR
jgi:hypothetical protein